MGDFDKDVRYPSGELREQDYVFEEAGNDENQDFFEAYNEQKRNALKIEGSKEQKIAQYFAVQRIRDTIEENSLSEDEREFLFDEKRVQKFAEEIMQSKEYQEYIKSKSDAELTAYLINTEKSPALINEAYRQYSKTVPAEEFYSYEKIRDIKVYDYEPVAAAADVGPQYQYLTDTAENIQKSGQNASTYSEKTKTSQKKIWGKSSQEFTDMTTALEEYEAFTKRMGDNPSKEDRIKLHEHQAKILDLSNKYIAFKEGKKLNSNGKKRFALAKDIQEKIMGDYLNSMDVAIEKQIEKPDAIFFDALSTSSVLSNQIVYLDNLAVRDTCKTLGINVACADIAKLFKESTSPDDLVKKLSENKTKTKINKVTERNKVIRNAELLFKAAQKDEEEVGYRRQYIERMLNNAKYPSPDRERLEKLADAINIQKVSREGDAKYLANVEKLRQARIKDIVESQKCKTNVINRPFNVFKYKENITQDERDIVINGINFPDAAGKLYDLALDEFAKVDGNKLSNVKSMDDIFSDLSHNKYVSEMIWDSQYMFEQMDYAIKTGKYKPDMNKYNAIKDFTKKIYDSAKLIVSKIELYESPQSMVIDVDTATMEASANGMTSNASNEADKTYFGQMTVFAGSVKTAHATAEEIELANDRKDVAVNPQCLEEKLDKYVERGRTECQKLFETISDPSRSLDEKEKSMGKMIDVFAKTGYFNMTKLNIKNVNLKEASERFAPKKMEAGVKVIKESVAQKMKSMSMAQLKNVVYSEEVDMKFVQELRGIQKEIIEKQTEAMKAEMHIDMKEPNKVQSEPENQKQAGPSI